RTAVHTNVSGRNGPFALAQGFGILEDTCLLIDLSEVNGGFERTVRVQQRGGWNIEGAWDVPVPWVDGLGFTTETFPGACVNQEAIEREFPRLINIHGGHVPS